MGMLLVASTTFLRLVVVVASSIDDAVFAARVVLLLISSPLSIIAVATAGGGGGTKGTMNRCPLTTPPSGTVTSKMMFSYMASKMYPAERVAGAITWTLVGGAMVFSEAGMDEVVVVDPVAP